MGGVHLPSIYMHCTKSSSGCSSMQGICAWLTGGSRSSSTSVVGVWYAGIYAWLTGGQGIYASIFMYCTRSSSGCSGMQGICAWLTGGSICLLYICIVLDLAVGVVVCKASMLNWLCTGIQGISHLPSIWLCILSWYWWGPSAFYVYALYYLAVVVAVCKASVLDWLGGLDLVVGVVVC